MSRDVPDVPPRTSVPVPQLDFSPQLLPSQRTGWTDRGCSTLLRGPTRKGDIQTTHFLPRQMNGDRRSTPKGPIRKGNDNGNDYVYFLYQPTTGLFFNGTDSLSTNPDKCPGMKN